MWQICDRYVTSTSEQVLKSKDIVKLCKVNFDISKLFIQCNTDNCCEHITGVMLIYIYMCVLVYWRLYVLYVFVCVCDMKSEC